MFCYYDSERLLAAIKYTWLRTLLAWAVPKPRPASVGTLSTMVADGMDAKSELSNPKASRPAVAKSSVEKVSVYINTMQETN